MEGHEITDRTKSRTAEVQTRSNCKRQSINHNQYQCSLFILLQSCILSHSHSRTKLIQRSINRRISLVGLSIRSRACIRVSLQAQGLLVLVIPTVFLSISWTVFDPKKHVSYVIYLLVVPLHLGTYVISFVFPFLSEWNETITLMTWYSFFQ